MCVSGRSAIRRPRDVLVHVCVKCTLWESDIGILEKGKSYNFQNVMVRSYEGTKYISIPKEDASVQVADTGDVIRDTVE